MACLRRVAELNNSGASMLVAARDKDAFRTLQTALAMMEQEMLAAPGKSRSSRGSTASACNSSVTQTSTACAAAAEDNSSSSDDSSAARFFIDTRCSTAIPELKDDRYFIFNQALLVDTNSTTTTSSKPPSSETADATTSTNSDPPQPHSQSLVCFYTSVVIYNLALVYHKRGMTAAAGSSSSTPTNTSTGAATAAVTPQPPLPISKDSARLALSQSLRLYEHCLKIVRSIANYSEDCKMLLYAVSCNLAHLYCRKGDRSRAQELLDGLEEANRLSYQNIL